MKINGIPTSSCIFFLKDRQNKKLHSKMKLAARLESAVCNVPRFWSAPSVVDFVEYIVIISENEVPCLTHIFVNLSKYISYVWKYDLQSCRPNRFKRAQPFIFWTNGDLISSISHWNALFSRLDTFRKLAKLSGKTSITETPEKLPEEALGYVTRGERHYSTVLQKGK